MNAEEQESAEVFVAQEDSRELIFSRFIAYALLYSTGIDLVTNDKVSITRFTCSLKLCSLQKCVYGVTGEGGSRPRLPLNRILDPPLHRVDPVSACELQRACSTGRKIGHTDFWPAEDTHRF